MPEACAARVASLLAQEMGWSYIHLEGNSMQVINAFNDREDDNLMRLSAVISACVSLISGFSLFPASFIRRTDNSLAHDLAHISLINIDVLDGVIPRPIWPVNLIAISPKKKKQELSKSINNTIQAKIQITSYQAIHHFINI